MNKLITATICTYKRYDVLPKAIASLEKQSLGKDKYQVIVVDNSPDYDFAETIKQKYHNPPYLTYVIEKIPGLSNARNVAAKTCGTEFISYMDDDAIASEHWLEKILAGFEQFGENAAVLGGRVDPLWESERPSWLNDDLLCYVSAINWGGGNRIAKDHEWFAGTNISFRTKEILANGGFDVDLGRNGGGSVLLSNEETQLLEKIRDQGKLPIYIPEASVHHLVENRRLTHSWFRQRIVWQAVSDYMMDSKTAVKDAQSGWDFVFEYLFNLPPRERTIRGLFYDTDDIQQFREQLWALSTVTTMMLTGFNLADS
ncbi:MAG: glycosyltransferase family 2 protein [Cyanobacteria bacterium P01_F01_bin.143]